MSLKMKPAIKTERVLMERLEILNVVAQALRHQWQTNGEHINVFCQDPSRDVVRQLGRYLD